jgi:DNA/RNA endonuclease G (NUC1)
MYKLIMLLVFVSCPIKAQVVQLDMSYYTTVFDTILKQPLYSKHVLSAPPCVNYFLRSSISINKLVSYKNQGNYNDYKGNKIFDRGHLVPVIDFNCDSLAVKKVDVYTNVMPQDKVLNRGVWRDLENYIKILHEVSGQNIVVYTGVVVGYRKLGKLKIPLFWYKMILHNGQYYAWLIPNNSQSIQPLPAYIVSPEIIKEKINKIGIEVIN